MRLQQNRSGIRYSDKGDDSDEDDERKRYMKNFQLAKESQKKAKNKAESKSKEETKTVELENIDRFLNTRDDSLKNKKLKELVQKNRTLQISLNNEKSMFAINITKSTKR